MSEEAARQTRSQKRALEKDHASHAVSPGEADSKRVKLEKGDAAGAPLALVGSGAEGVKLKSEQAAKVAASILKSGEVKATIKVEVQTGDEPVDMSTSKRWDGGGNQRVWCSRMLFLCTELLKGILAVFCSAHA